MNLKPVTAAFLALGLASSSALAAKEAHEHHSGHRMVTNTRPLLHDIVGSESIVNHNNAKSPVSAQGWPRRIHLSGLVNVDARYAARGPLGIVPLYLMSDDSNELNVNNANLFFDVSVNNCVKTHIGLAYVSDSVNNFDLPVRTSRGFEEFTKQIRSDRSSVFAGGELSVDEAYISIDDFANSPLYFRAGKMYLPFGTYRNPYPITYSFPQLFSQTRATAVEMGFVTSYGFYASAYILDGAISSRAFADELFNPVRPGNEGDNDRDHIPYTRVNNWGLQLGYIGETSCFDYHVNGGFIKDIRDINFFADIQDLLAYDFTSNRNDNSADNGFGMRLTGGVHVHGDMNYGIWNFSADYVSALRNMVRDPQNFQSETSARPWAGDLTATYNNNFLGYPGYLSLSYQRTGQADGIVPKFRYVGQASAEVYPHTNLTLEVSHNRDYDRGSDHFVNFLNRATTDSNGQVLGGTGRSNNQATLRLGVEF